MSYVNKEGKTSEWRKMVRRQQVTDVISYGRITTTAARAKESQKHVDELITLAKKNTLPATRKIYSIILDNPNLTREEQYKKLVSLAKKYADRNGGYTRVLKLGKRAGDNTEEAILELV